MSAATDPFVPLSLGGPVQGKRDEFRVLVAACPENARPLRDANAAAVAAASARSPGSACEPRVLLQREGGCITGIRIHCSCGQVIDLKCAYAEGSPSPARCDSSAGAGV
jgi:hypothetical protein